MLREANLEDVNNYLEFAYRLSQDFENSFFPTYLDGIKTKEDFYNSAFKSFEDENSKILLFEIDGEVLGWIDFYWLPSDLYLGIRVFNVKEFKGKSIEEFIEYAKQYFSKYTIFFGLPSKNIESVNYLKKIGTTKVEENYVYTLNFEEYQPKEYDGEIIKVNEENWNDFSNLHDKIEGIYWNSERLYKQIFTLTKNKWNIYLYYEEGQVKGTIYFVYTPLLMEIFGVDFQDNKFDKKIMNNLLIKALNVSKSDGQKYMTYFVGEEEIDIVEKLGFKFLDKYELYKLELN